MGAGAGYWDLVDSLADSVVVAAQVRHAALNPAGENILHVTVVTKDYVRLALNWALSLERAFAAPAYLIGCLDKVACYDLAALGVGLPHILDLQNATAGGPAIVLGEPEWLDRSTQATARSVQALGRTGRFWWQRLSLVRMLLREVGPGGLVAMSDADAVWVRPPAAGSAWRHPTADLIASQGTFPADVYSAWGTTVCMGLAVWRSSSRTLALLAAVLDDLARTRDDQVSVNRLLVQLDTAWAPGALPRHGRTALGVPLEVVLIPTVEAPRECPPEAMSALQETAVAFHCLVPKAAADKETALQALALWLVPARDRV